MGVRGQPRRGLVSNNTRPCRGFWISNANSVAGARALARCLSGVALISGNPPRG